MSYSALALSGHYCLQVTIAPAYPNHSCLFILSRFSQTFFFFFSILCRAAFNAAYSHTGGERGEFILGRINFTGGGVQLSEYRVRPFNLFVTPRVRKWYGSTSCRHYVHGFNLSCTLTAGTNAREHRCPFTLEKTTCATQFSPFSLDRLCRAIQVLCNTFFLDI